MKKRIISALVAVLLIACTGLLSGCIVVMEHTCKFDTFGGYTVVDGKVYEVVKCSCGNAYNTNPGDNLIVATPENAQSVLDGELGSLDGKTVFFMAGEYTQKLYFGRPNSSIGSNTAYKGLQGETVIEGIDAIAAMTWGSRYYTRAISNVTFTGEEGVVLPSIEASSGHVHGDGHDYVLDVDFTGSGYYLTHIFENITFKGLSFAGNLDFETAQGVTMIGEEVFQPATSIDGLSFVDCSFTTGGTESDKGAALRVYSENENDNQVIKNVSLVNCKFNNCRQGLYSHHVYNVTVNGCEFDGTGHNAIAIQCHGNLAFNHGDIAIIGNTFKNVGDRIIRFNTADAKNITITGNVAVNCGDEDGQVIKATSLAEGITYVISGNNWGEGAVIANAELVDEAVEE